MAVTLPLYTVATLESLVDHFTSSATMPPSSSRVIYTPRLPMVTSVFFSFRTLPAAVPLPVPTFPPAVVGVVAVPSAAEVVSVAASVVSVWKLTTAGVSSRSLPQVTTMVVSPSPTAVTRPYSSMVTMDSSPEV